MVGKLFLFVFLFYIVSSTEIEPYISPLDGPIKEALKKLTSCFDSKVLDMEQPLKISSDLAKVDLMLNHLTVTGLTSLDLKKYSSKPNKGFDINLDLSFTDKISIKTLYSLNSVLGNDMLRVFGTGYLETEISNLHIDIKIHLNVGKDKLVTLTTFDSIDTGFMNAENFKFNIEGLMNDELLSNIISDQLPKVIVRTFKDYGGVINESLKNLVKLAVDGKTIAQIQGSSKFNCDDLLKGFIVQ